MARIIPGWTVAKLSATLSHFEEFTSMKAVRISCIRRSLIYPLMRSYTLSGICWEDAISIFKQGTKRVLSCLLQIHEALEDDSDGRHLLNDLYVDDYCIWLQRQCKPNRLQDIAQRMSETEVNKEDVGLNLPTLESRFAEVRFPASDIATFGC